jgi:dihydrodipicolinate synthase/N-acetylneuraminate lyase
VSRAAQQFELAGVFAAAVTPHRAGVEGPDFSAMLDLVDFLAAGGVRGVCLLGTTGEFLDYSFTERQRLVYLAVKRSRVPVIAGVSHSTLAGAIQLAGEATAAGAECLLLAPPYYFRYGQREIEEFYMQFARETGDTIPLLLYNIPQFTSKIEVETIRKLIDTGRFAGIKDSSGDWPHFEQLIALKKERPFTLLCGDETISARALAAGADGLISGCACAVPELLAGLSRAVTAGDSSLADQLDARLQEFVAWTRRFPFPVGIKRAVELRGQKAGPPLTPLAPETQQVLAEFSAWFKAWLPEMRKAAVHA